MNNNSTQKLNNLILHIHPKQVPERALKFTLTWGLGGMAALLIVLLAFTGILLRFVYVPTPEGAYDSIITIKNNVTLGNLVRNIHYWSATLLIIVSFLHMIRVLFTGAYTGKRRSNWIIGLCSLILLLLMNFTGYLLPWDQLAYWAVTVSTNMLKYIPIIGDALFQGIVQGEEIGASTLLVFYSLHTGLFPLTIVILVLFHFWKVRKAGGVVIPQTNNDEAVKKVPVWPNLLARELVTALVLLAVIMMLSIIFDAPLKERANPLISPNPAKAAWYFMGFQELLLHFQPFIAIVLIPLLALSLLFYIPYIKGNEPQKGFWFLSATGRKTAVNSMILSTVLTAVFVLINEFLIKPSSFSPFLKSGTIPFLLLIVFLLGLIKFNNKKYNTNKAETIQSVLSFVLTAFIILTIIGSAFRGEGMALTF